MVFCLLVFVGVSLMSVSECYNCKHADEYVAYWWFPYYAPTCSKGLPMNTYEHCLDFKQIGRLSR